MKVAPMCPFMRHTAAMLTGMSTEDTGLITKIINGADVKEPAHILAYQCTRNGCQMWQSSKLSYIPILGRLFRDHGRCGLCR